jgi:hypothetical protein
MGIFPQNDKEQAMLELEGNGFYPLTQEHLDMHVPSQAGIYTLAIRLANGVHHTFFTSQSDNVYRSLRRVIHGNRTGLQLPPEVHQCLETYRCYFSYWIIANIAHRNEVWKTLSQTADPVKKLTVVNCN